MTDWRMDITDALADFCKVAQLAGVPLELAQLDVEFLDAPHRPPSSLPSGKMATYGFWSSGQWLKIGMVGPNSQARYVSQHYNAGSARSVDQVILQPRQHSPFSYARDRAACPAGGVPSRAFQSTL